MGPEEDAEPVWCPLTRLVQGQGSEEEEQKSVWRADWSSGIQAFPGMVCIVQGYTLYRWPSEVFSFHPSPPAN